MHYVVARIRQKKEDETYKFYIADMLQGQFTGQYIVTHLKDILHPQYIEQKSAEEIIEDVVSRAGLTIQ